MDGRGALPGGPCQVAMSWGWQQGSLMLVHAKGGPPGHYRPIVEWALVQPLCPWTVHTDAHQVGQIGLALMVTPPGLLVERPRAMQLSEAGGD